MSGSPIPARVSELTVGQLSDRSGVAVSALRFYEDQGLLAARRTPGNQRRYPRVALRRVAFIRASQSVGIPLSRIKEALDGLPAERAPTPADWALLSERWRADGLAGRPTRSGPGERRRASSMCSHFGCRRWGSNPGPSD